ncbi:bacillithiol biosynthesis cysteine-adding enzyme BshC [Belliella aquatica]|uniref:Putative cysteine ligase BshC n=1 Tax=Belliella aquatica TaxID=1323734 RepID=A0ABQ1LSK1_9BACT|nr:bacillithiol biosynthesis cysteine-adding enzyme BshC [Belliella aquatica]MCH7404557.1 bacillithiol biosynthesis cysteine-adding enzyme BshC [Belliella aquatica]GGC29107.1 putative cysteine ligase BshC [Belliella aquatica]
MIKATVDPACTGQFSQLFLDYIQEKPELRDFYSQYPRIENFDKLIEAKKFTAEKREILVQSLKSQYQEIDFSDDFAEQIESLGKENTFTVTTGHQLNLFTGPLYFIYKIVSTVNLAKQLGKKYPQHHFVPVYWMATEDHDFDEINYFKLDGKKYQWNSDQSGAVGDFELDKSFAEFLKSVSFAPDFFKEAYSSSKTLAEAVRKYVHHLFGEKGLVIVDGNDSELKKLLIPVIEQDILTGVANEKAQEQTDKLEALGYKSQIFPREINFFYMENGLRERIEKRDKTYYILDTELKFEEEEIKALIHNCPEKFSPNVVLRPLYQEMILPNIAYLGGPAEVIYWLQLKTVFDHFGEVFPAVMPRNFALVLDSLTVKKMNSLSLSNEDLFCDYIAWKKSFVAEKSSLDIFLKAEKEKLSRIFEESGTEASQVDQSLNSAYEAAKVRVSKIMDHLSGKVRKAEERRLRIEIGRMDAIKAFINPNGSPQERVENFMKFYLENPYFIDELLGLFDPFDFNFMILKPEND